MSPAMPRSIIHISCRLTLETRCTMRELRYRRFVWRCAGTWVAAGEYRTARAIAKAWQYYGSVPPPRIYKKILRRGLDDDPPVKIR